MKVGDLVYIEVQPKIGFFETYFESRRVTHKREYLVWVEGYDYPFDSTTGFVAVNVRLMVRPDQIKLAKQEIKKAKRKLES